MESWPRHTDDDDNNNDDDDNNYDDYDDDDNKDNIMMMMTRIMTMSFELDDTNCEYNKALKSKLTIKADTIWKGRSKIP